jgi:nitroreductase
MQPWVFVVVRDAGQRHAIGEHLRRVWGTAGGIERLSGRMPPEAVAAIDEGMKGGVADAPVLIVVAGDLDRVEQQWLSSSIFPSVQNILLAAGALGLGSALTTLATSDGQTLAAIVGLPSSIRPMALLPIGYPVLPLGPPRRESFREHTWREAYGQPW